MDDLRVMRETELLQEIHIDATIRRLKAIELEASQRGCGSEAKRRIRDVLRLLGKEHKPELPRFHDVGNWQI